MKKLRVAHYNIYNGGKERILKIISIIKKIDPDICGILEAVGWGNQIKKYKKLFKLNGYNFLYLIKSNTKYDIVIISKKKIKVTSIKNNIWHSIGKVTLKNFDIYYVHLNPKLEQGRLNELHVLNKKINKDKNNLIMGDFNSLSLHDKYSQKELLKKFNKHKITKFGTTKLKFDVIRKMEKNGFIDVFNYINKKFESSTPTLFNTDINHKEKIRIDYAFINKKNINNILNCKIYKNKITEKASDHYPLYLDIKN